MKHLFLWGIATITLVSVLSLMGFQRTASAQESPSFQYTGGEHFFTGILTCMEKDYITVTLTQDSKDGTENVRFPAGTKLRFSLTADLQKNIMEEALQEGDKVTAMYDDSIAGTDLNVITIGLPQPGFSDVDARDYYADPVRWAREQGITNGITPNTFGPEKICTRAQSITFLWRSAGFPEPTIKNPFSDISTGSYYEKAAVWAAEMDIAVGENFSPSLPCTRAMAVEFLWKQAGSPDATPANFVDVNSDVSYAKAVGWAVANGITCGTTVDTFSPEQTCTRVQMVTFLYRALGNDM